MYLKQVSLNTILFLFSVHTIDISSVSNFVIGITYAVLKSSASTDFRARNTTEYCYWARFLFNNKIEDGLRHTHIIHTVLTKSNLKGCKRCSNTIWVDMTTLLPRCSSVVNDMVLRSSVNKRNHLILKQRYLIDLNLQTHTPETNITLTILNTNKANVRP